MNSFDPVSSILRDYPRIYFACHRRHTRDPHTKALVSEKQARILDHLDATVPLSLSSLASHMGVTPGTMSVAVNRLVANRLVKRTSDPADRRGVLLRLAPAGKRICQAHSVLDPERVQSLLDALQPGERARAVEGLTLLAKAAEKAAALRAPRSSRGPA